MTKLSGKVVVVTGAAMGNGFGIAEIMARHGARVALWDICDKVESAAKKLRDAGHQALACQVDVREFNECSKAAEAVAEHFGHIDVLCNNAGIIRLGKFLETSDEVRDLHFDVNIKGVWNCTQAVLPYIQIQESGAIVNMSSVTGTMVADEGEVAYATTKAAILGFTKGMARELAASNIRVNAICPGYILTPMAQQIANESDPENPEAVIDGIASTVPMGRLGQINEVGELAAFLASSESSYITGTQIVIDGGSTLPETIAVGA